MSPFQLSLTSEILRASASEAEPFLAPCLVEGVCNERKRRRRIVVARLQTLHAYIQP